MSETVGVVGAGRMGLPIIGHLARAGFGTLATDIDPQKEPEVQRRAALWVPDAASLARECDIILVCVGLDREVRELLAPGGALRSARRGSVCAVLSTIHPRTIQDLSGQNRAVGLEVIDSTVCRGGEAADRGTLLSFVGGPRPVVERVTPVLRAYSADVVHTGGVGSAQVAKAVNNLIMWACLVADHEGLAHAQRYGLDTDLMRSALAMSSAAHAALAKWGTPTMPSAEDDRAI